ncbi:MAG: tyrosine-type recombinase/integrase [SAR202 cluster bacterium]|nr:tyrosine-type recombinase/integrase [SAR202 cluster bacterium]
MATKRNLRWEEMEKSKIDLSVLMQHFEVNNRTEGKSPRTVGWYNEVLGLFVRWLNDEESSTAIGNIDENTVRRFILHIQEKPGIKGHTSTHTVANRVRALKAFFAWLGKKGYTVGDLLRELKMPKTVDQVIEPLNEEDIGKIFSGINANTLLGARNCALVSLMLDTGLRLSEVAYLEESDVHLEDRYVKVLGKGGKERIVAFGVACQRAMLHYCHHFRVDPSHNGVSTFFLTIDGYPLSPYAIKSFFRRLSKAVGISRLHPHLLRHTYATSFILNGGDIFLLKQNLGHSTLVMVQNYLHIASRRAAIQSQEFSPLDRFNLKDSRRYKHGMDRSNMDGKIYSNAGRQRSH